LDVSALLPISYNINPKRRRIFLNRFPLAGGGRCTSCRSMRPFFFFFSRVCLSSDILNTPAPPNAQAFTTHSYASLSEFFVLSLFVLLLSVSHFYYLHSTPSDCDRRWFKGLSYLTSKLLFHSFPLRTFESLQTIWSRALCA